MKRVALLLLGLLAGPVRAAEPGLAPGRYALTLRVATLADAPWFPTVRGGSTSHVLVDLSGAPEAMTQRSRVCRVDIDGGGIARIEVPPAFLAALGPREVTADTSGGRYRVDLGSDVVGYAGDGPLPTDLAQTTDWDGDGHPAATIRVHIPAIGAAQMYVVQAARLVLDGAIGTTGASGSIDVRRFEQKTLGARPGWLASKTEVRVDPTRSGFTLTAIGPEAGCDAVVAAAGG